MIDQPNAADFDFSFTLQLRVHGWLSVCFFLPGGPRHYSPSQVCGCPLAALLNATTRLAEGARGEEFEWFLEPSSVFLRISASESDSRDVSVACWEHARYPAPVRDRSLRDPEWAVTVRLDYWLALTACEFRRIVTLLQFPEHAASRRWGFSPRELASFEKAVRNRCGVDFVSGNLSAGLPSE